MATKGKKIEYGMSIGNVAQVNSDSTITKASFFEQMEKQYPSSEGWEVYSTSTAALTGTVFTVAYHLKRVIE